MSTAVKERPILFSAEMVRAILDGRKTQTRRVVKLKPGEEIDNGAVFSAKDPFLMVWPYGKVGDRLWVKETWCCKYDEDDRQVYNADGNLDSTCCWYKADGLYVRAVDGDGFGRYNKDGSEKSPWSSPIYMPRWASRITLEITGVRVERLQDISAEDAIAEGCEVVQAAVIEPYSNPPKRLTLTAVNYFHDLWDRINGPDSWAANPWVWVVEFRRLVSE